MTRPARTRVVTALLAVLLATATGCGDAGATGAAESSDAPYDADAPADGDWLLRFTTAGGADGERTGAVYVSYNPTTGAAFARSVPAVSASDAGQDEQVLLVSADHRWAIPDTGVPKAQARTGKLVLYSVTADTTETVDIRAATGDPTMQATAWAFDPEDGATLRVVGADLVVWKVDLASKSATREGQLPRRSGWIFGNGFDKNTGEPYIESIDSDETEPAGNGDSDTRPVDRQGGALVRYDGEDVEGLPTPPCGFAGGFRYADGRTWLFCADTPSISAYGLAQSDHSWEPFGKPSAKVVPGSAVEMTFALPPLT